MKVLYRGEPVAGAEIIRDFVTDPDAQTIKSDDNGVASFEIRNQGLNVIKAFYATDSSDREGVDSEQIVATLSFVLPHEPE